MQNIKKSTLIHGRIDVSKRKAETIQVVGPVRKTRSEKRDYCVWGCFSSRDCLAFVRVVNHSFHFVILERIKK
jgi:hypothetical protein